MRTRLPAVADAASCAIIAEVPTYANALSGHMGETIRNAVQLALGGFISAGLAPSGDRTRRRPPRRWRGPTSWAAARRAAAARWTPCWRPTGSAPGSPGARCRPAAVRTAWTPQTLAKFAELVFAYIDELSAASAAGHTDELATTGRVRQRLLDASSAPAARREPDAAGRGRRAGRLAAARDADRRAAARGAACAPVLALVDPRTLAVTDPRRTTRAQCCWCPTRRRAVLLLRHARGAAAVVGPARPWTLVRSSYLRARAGASTSPTPTPTPSPTSPSWC